MTIKPVGDKVAVQYIEEDVKKTASGIIIPNTLEQKHKLAKVLAVGEGSYTKDGVLIPLSIKVDDTVLVTSGAGVEVSVWDLKAVIVKENDILAVIG